ncbi:MULTISPECIES: hypothetical protein [unclassified Pseudomonas]|uniref:hypothetical protein n=1 Tax=unclassified Pseudomonas TaxID=196821 RepID=UPI001CC016D7|nr:MULTISPECIES: hypothetical protein [unclassified Pseudomonas]
MNGMKWGLLGPDTVVSARRARTLGLGATVRFFNEQAVPGIGGVWYGKQLWYAVLGIALAGRSQATGQKSANIKAANAIEALACWLALDGNKWQTDSRLRGATKLRGVSDLSFKSVSKPGFYVTQPMRMATVQVLPVLGLVQSDATRFNQYQLSEHCLRRFDLGDKPNGGYGREIFDHIYLWNQGRREAHTGRYKAFFYKALSPLEPMDEPLRCLLTDVLHSGGESEPHASKLRRRKALQWVEGLRQQPEQALSWNSRPTMLDDEHWHDLRTGAAFFALRDQSLGVLDALESHLGTLQNGRSFDLSTATLPQSVLVALAELRQLASTYKALGHSEPAAFQFCRECSAEADAAIVRHLVERDGRVLRLMGSVVLPGPAFDGAPSVNSTESETPPEEVDQRRLKWPTGMSSRMSNLFFLNADLHGDLDTWLSAAPLPHSEES